jgi:hypothetical protein
VKIKNRDYTGARDRHELMDGGRSQPQNEAADRVQILRETRIVSESWEDQASVAESFRDSCDSTM